jgi:hypothetical protein
VDKKEHIMKDGHGPTGEINIIINGRPRKIAGPEISFEQAVALAFDPVPPNALFTVTWSHGNQEGSLIAGNSVKVQNGTKFDVTETGQS